MTVIGDLKELFDARGDSEYGGESVTQLEHALQAAALAEAEKAPPALIVAALLHDIGHLLHDLPDDAPDRGVDDHHENSAHNYLKSMFGPDVCEPVRQHVAAKRYLCAVDNEYIASLSQPSLVSLDLQGGPMSQEEVGAFEASEHYQDSLRLRKWDDLAKVKDLQTPTIEHFLQYVDQVVL